MSSSKDNLYIYMMESVRINWKRMDWNDVDIKLPTWLFEISLPVAWSQLRNPARRKSAPFEGRGRIFIHESDSKCRDLVEKHKSVYVYVYVCVYVGGGE